MAQDETVAAFQHAEQSFNSIRKLVNSWVPLTNAEKPLMQYCIILIIDDRNQSYTQTLLNQPPTTLARLVK